MRTPSFKVLLILILAVACATPSTRLSAASAEFLSWATARSDECDLSWNRVTGASARDLTARLSNRPETAFDSLTTSNKIMLGAKLSRSIISSRSFYHSVTSDGDFLPSSTRERGEPGRGVQGLKNPAQARLGGPHDVRRPLNSSVQQTTVIRRFGDVVRPRLNSFGRLSKSSQLHNGAVARPAGRGTRAHKL